MADGKIVWVGLSINCFATHNHISLDLLEKLMVYQSRLFRIILSVIVLSGMAASHATPAAGRSARQPVLDRGAAQNLASSKTFIPSIFNEIPEWPTVGADSQRTSWTKEQVSGTNNMRTLNVSWYRPVDAYIPQNVQLIAAHGMIFVATARGLYALDAATGSEVWRLDTRMPIGNSPTVYNGTVYVAGYDRKLYALHAMTGARLWEFDGAQAGFEASPLVVENLVVLGNRDGNLYAVGAQGHATPGQLVWKIQTGGPIHMTAAYKNGVVYVASGDMHAYAVNINGTLKWKSSKLPGDGFQSYWPVVFTDPTTKKDLVIFSGASGYRFDDSPGTRSVLCDEYNNPSLQVPCNNTRFEVEDLFFDKSTAPDTPLGSTVSLSEPWAAGKTVLNYSRVTQYFENNPQAHAYLHKPWRRYYFVLNTSNGTEYTFDSDGDGYQEYAPVVPFTTDSGNAYPPVVGKDGLLYFSNLWLRSGQGRVMGWRVGTPYMVLGGGQGDTAEPQAISGGGDYLYRSICCDRVGDWYDTTNLARYGFAWSYFSGLSNQIPGYDVKWWFDDPTILDRLVGNFGTVNGVYHNHGDQNPLIPYKGRLYIHRSNAVIAYGPNIGSNVGEVDAEPPETVVSPLARQDLQNRLNSEVSKMIAAGHLRPGYYNAGQFSSYKQLNTYFENPGDTLYTLARAYPYVNPAVQGQLKDYLQDEFERYFDPVMYSYTGWAEGAAREAVALPPEVTADMLNYQKQASAGPGWTWQYPQYNFYGMWKYAEIFQDDPVYVDHIYDLALSKLQAPVPAAATADLFRARPYELNGYIAGYIGFLNLQALAGRNDRRAEVTGELNRLMDLRARTFSKDTFYVSFIQGNSLRTLNVARNFIMLVPELGDYLHDNAFARVQAAVAEYNAVAPYWFVSRYNGSIGESAMQNLYDYNAMFQAEAYIMKLPYDELTLYLDAPAFETGDLFYIQNLTAALEAP